ncbi:unnamed protein product, partial [Rotaria magnacalcarata]
LYSWLQLPISR